MFGFGFGSLSESNGGIEMSTVAFVFVLVVTATVWGAFIAFACHAVDQMPAAAEASISDQW